MGSARSGVTTEWTGNYVRVGRTPTQGPIFRLRRYDRHRNLWTLVNPFTQLESQMPHEDIEAAIAEGIMHIVGKAKADS